MATAGRCPREHRPHTPTLQSEDWGRHAGGFPVRHTPHPRRVCHIKGLNNIPICAVIDDVYRVWSPGQFSPAEEEEDPAARRSAPRPAALRSPGVSPPSQGTRLPPRPHSAPCKRVQECFRTCAENPLVTRKEETEAQQHPLPPRASSTAGSCSSEVLRPKAAARESTVCIPNYLDQEIKILAKLCGILHTDSLADVIQWLLHAGPKEKEWVSALIHAELSEINLLTHLQRSTSASRATQNWIPPKAKAPPNPLAKLKVPSRCREAPGASRSSTLGSEEGKEAVREAGHKPPLFIRRSSTKIPVVEYFSKPVSLVRVNTQESAPASSAARNTQPGQAPSPQRAFHP